MLSRVWLRLRRSTLVMFILLIAIATAVALPIVLLSISNIATVSGPILQAQSVSSATTPCPSIGYTSSLSLTWTVVPNSATSQFVCLINTGNASYTLSGCNISPATGDGTVICTPNTGILAPGGTQLVTVTWTAPGTTGTFTFEITFS